MLSTNFKRSRSLNPLLTPFIFADSKRLTDSLSTTARPSLKEASKFPNLRGGINCMRRRRMSRSK